MATVLVRKVAHTTSLKAPLAATPSKAFYSNNAKNMNRLRRVLFNVPGSDARKITKASKLNLDCVVLDLEDGVAINQKENARQMIVDTLNNKDIQFGRAGNFGVNVTHKKHFMCRKVNSNECHKLWT
jgi:citrate lyase subunit beta-like protein